MALDIRIKDGKIYAPLLDRELIATPEEKIRQRYIQILKEKYGYQYDQMQQEVKLTSSKRGNGRASADIVIWRSEKDKTENNNPVIVVECKAENITIKEEDYYQGQNYAYFANAPFFVTYNLKETKFFKVNLTKTPKHLGDEITKIPNASEVNNLSLVKKILEQTKAFERDEFSRLLFKCHNIIRNNDKLSPEAAFDEISKILFMKIRYERNQDEGSIFTLEQFKKEEENYEKNIRPVNVKRNGEKDNISYVTYWFELTKIEFREDDLFDENDTIKIRQSSFEAIIRELQKYNLSKTDDDVKGIAFEEFLGRTFRGELGQFFTPRTVVDFMVEVLDPQEGEIICDPCCGSGGFLIKAFEYVRDKIETDIQEEKYKVINKFDEISEKAKTEKERENINNISSNIISKLSIELEIRKKEIREKSDFTTRLEHLSTNCIYGTDANPRMARTSKMNMIMHGDGHGGVHHNDGLLPKNGIIRDKFDVILTNPPFGSRVEKSLNVREADLEQDENNKIAFEKKYGKDWLNEQKYIKNNIGKSILSLFDTGSMSSLTEVLFIERCFHLLKAGGRLGIVLPEGVLNTQNLQKVREYFESKAKILLVTSIPQDVFMKSGATVKPSLLFFKKFTKKETKLWNKLEKKNKSIIEAIYKDELEEINNKLTLRGNNSPDKDEKKRLRTRKKEIENTIRIETRQKVKEAFDYEIPIVEVEKAGISTTGSKTENELIEVKNEFTPYRKENGLWEDNKPNINYLWEEKNIKVIRKYDEGLIELSL